MTTLYTNHIRAWIDLGSDQNVLGNGNIAGSSGSVGGTGPIGEIDGFAVGITGSGVHAVTGTRASMVLKSVHGASMHAICPRRFNARYMSLVLNARAHLTRASP